MSECSFYRGILNRTTIITPTNTIPATTTSTLSTQRTTKLERITTPPRIDPFCHCWGVSTATHPPERKVAWLTPSWQRTLQRNVVLVEPYYRYPTRRRDDDTATTSRSSRLRGSDAKTLDVLLLGDGLTEHWLGTNFAVRDDLWRGAHEVYQRLFRPPNVNNNKSNSNDADEERGYATANAVRGLALGITGDRNSQLLYRLQQLPGGEFPLELDVPIVWITIGMMDWTMDECSVDAVVAGNVAIVEEILTTRPSVQRIVLNGLFPHQDLPTGLINRHLECYTHTKNHTVEFYNPAPLVLNPDGTVNRSLFQSDMYLSGEGHRVWGESIVRRVTEIKHELGIAVRTETNPQNPSLVASTSLVAPSASLPSVVPTISPVHNILLKDVNQLNETRSITDSLYQPNSMPDDTIPSLSGHNPRPPVDFSTQIDFTPVTGGAPGRLFRCESFAHHYWDIIDVLSTSPDRRCDGTTSTSCQCLDPSVPKNRLSKAVGDTWYTNWNRHVRLINSFVQTSRSIDVLMLGDSIIERFSKFIKDGHLSTNFIPDPRANLFDNPNLFRRSMIDRASMKALAFGIEGDRSVNLLWRIRNGELHNDLNVGVIWVNIGVNDISDNCNPDAVAAGNIAVVEEILNVIRPGRIVINSMLPGWNSYQEVNLRLECYAASRKPWVEFFNATKVFLTSTGERNSALFDDWIHPSDEGYRLWGRDIAKRSKEIEKELGIDEDYWGGVEKENHFGINSTFVESPIDDIPSRSNSQRNPFTCMRAYNLINVNTSLFPPAASSSLRSSPMADKCEWGSPCACNTPALPSVRTNSERRLWGIARNRNLSLLRRKIKSPRRLDVLLLGDSITEHWLGSEMGVSRPTEWQESFQAYRYYFLRQKAEVRGLALGIGGDRSSNLMYRIQHGELPVNSSIPVIWVTIGAFDVNDACNADAIISSHIAIAEEILRQRAGQENTTRVVINSLLPRGTQSSGTRLTANDRNWELLQRVNRGLACYAEIRGNQVEFFDATGLFLTSNFPVERNETLFYDEVHPSGAGYWVWGRAITDRVKQIKAEMGLP